jgi:hypothetical protein
MKDPMMTRQTREPPYAKVGKLQSHLDVSVGAETNALHQALGVRVVAEQAQIQVFQQ